MKPRIAKSLFEYQYLLSLCCKNVGINSYLRKRPCFFFFNLHLRTCFYWFEREWNIDWLPPIGPQPGIEPTTYVYALIGNWNHNSGVQDDTPSNWAIWPGWKDLVLRHTEFVLELGQDELGLKALRSSTRRSDLGCGCQYVPQKQAWC